MEDLQPEDSEPLTNALRTICERVARRAVENSLAFRTVTVKIRYNDFSTIQRSHSLPIPVYDSTLLYATAVRLLNIYRDHQRPIRLLGVKVSGLSEYSSQSCLTDFI